jgi:predicted TIM-barrel fold metal-dependent hydrolase
MRFAAMTEMSALGVQSKYPSETVGAIDTHAHIFERGLPLSDDRRYVPTYDATLRDYLQVLDANGISHGVLVQPSFLGIDNSYLLGGLRSAQGRLRGIAVVSPNISLPSLRALSDAGIVGIRLNLLGRQLPPFDAEPWSELLRMIATLGWQVEIQRTAGDILLILPPLLNAGVSVVIDHFGLLASADSAKSFGSWVRAAGKKSRRLWVKLSAPYRSGGGQAGEVIVRTAYPQLRDAVGLDRLIWGSDWPHTQFEATESYQKARAFLDDLIPDKTERSAILNQNPASLFQFDNSTLSQLRPITPEPPVRTS